MTHPKRNNLENDISERKKLIKGNYEMRTSEKDKIEKDSLEKDKSEKGNKALKRIWKIN